MAVFSIRAGVVLLLAGALAGCSMSGDRSAVAPPGDLASSVRTQRAYGPVVAAPTSVSLTATGDAGAMDVRVSQAGFAGRFAKAGDCTPQVVTIRPLSNGSGLADFKVVGVGAGSCTAKILGAGNAFVFVPISVLPGDVVVNPTSLKFTSSGASPQRVSVSQTNNAQNIAESDDCSKVATLAGNVAGTSFLVTPVAPGSCSATFTAAAGKTAKLPISVAPAGNVVVTPASLNFSSTGGSAAKSVAVSQSNATQPPSESDNCSKIATFSKNGGGTQYAVTPLALGSCSATFSGQNGKSAKLPVSVTSPLIAVVCNEASDVCANGTATSPGSIEFTVLNDTAKLTPSDPGWAGAPPFVFKSDTCNKTDDPSAGGNWATFSPLKGASAASFTVTAAATGTTNSKADCAAVFSDANGATVNVNIEVTTGSVGVH